MLQNRMAKVVLLLLLAITNASPVQTTAPSIVDAARQRYGGTLQRSITRVTSEIIKATLGRACPDLVTSANFTTDADVGGFDLADATMHVKLAGLFDAFAQQHDSFITHILQHAIQGQSPLDVGYARSVIHNCDSYAATLKQAGGSLDLKLQNASLAESGGGMGFGFQVYCGCELLVTSGAGMGGGMTVSPNLPVMGGLGGGGGLQMFANTVGESSPIVNVGGGGGGDLSGCAGSTDFAQITPVDSIKEAQTRFMHKQIQACPAGALSIVGGGGGGMGFVVSTPGKPDSNVSAITAYGGGLNLKFMNADAPANDAKCAGKLLESTSGHASSYTAVNAATAKCRKQCHSSASKGLAAFWKCTCPCTQLEFTHLNLTFAPKMKCD